MKRLANKVAVITGATSGIGRAIATRFADEGATLLLCGRDRGRAQSLLSELNDSGADARFLLGDIRSDQFVAEVSESVRDLYGQIDCLVLNAGVYSVGRLWEITPEQYDDMMTVNVRAPWLCIKHLHHQLSEGATVVTLGSVSSFAVFEGEGVYCMTKAAVLQMTRMLALELADRRIRVNALCPGMIGGGGMTQNSFDASADPDSGRRALEAVTPMGRLGTLEEVADGAVFLASDESSFMTGSSLLLDGGIIIPRA